ncbi:MAG: WD40/YVTN/BNR-like repeat-containing protein [Burkholderiales bacterium]
MKLPKATRSETKARTASRAAGKIRYPLGKALARIHYFEAQRGIALTRYERGRVVTVREATVPRARSAGSASRARSPKVPYTEAAVAKAKLEPSKFAAAANLPVWRELGPTKIPRGQTYGKGGNNQPSVSGRCCGIFIDPTDRRRLILCSAGGGLWGSKDTGATWVPLTDDQPSLSMGAIAGAPSSPNIVYAGTGEGDSRTPLGVGLLRSADGGWTWTHAPIAALSGTGIYDIAVDPANPLHLWVAAVNGFYESLNGGDTVRAVRTGMTWDISIRPDNPKEIFVACDAGLLRSANGGSTWTRVTLPGASAGLAFERMEVCHAPSNPNIVYVAAATDKQAFLWRRASAAGAFSSEAIPKKMEISQAWYDWCFAISPADPNVVYWGAIELFRGKRSGSTISWTNIASRDSGDSIHPDQHDLRFDPSDARTLYACNDGGIFRSPDGGTSWQSLNPGLAITEFEFLSQLESEDAWVTGGTQDNGTLTHVGAGQWNQIALGDGGDCAAADGPKPLSFHSYYGIWIERAAATGANAFKWTDVSPPAPDNYAAMFYPPMDLMGRVLAKAGSSVFVSDDAGDSWEEVVLPTSKEANPDVASAIVVFSPKIIFVGMEHGAIYRLTRGAQGWAKGNVEPLTSPRQGGFISDIVVPGAVNAVIWATSSTFGDGHVFYSSNGGKTWTNRSGNLPDIPVNALVVDPANTSTLYAATDNGVYRSTDAGKKWIDFSNGLPNALVGDLILHVRRRVLRAGTRNRGCWEVSI